MNDLYNYVVATAGLPYEEDVTSFMDDDDDGDDVPRAARPPWHRQRRRQSRSEAKGGWPGLSSFRAP